MLRKHTNENWALKGHSKVTPKALEHSGTQGSLALEALRHSKDTWALRHSANGEFEALAQ